jgi:hypothetical protein
MPPVIFEARDVVGGGRYLQEVRFSEVPVSADFPEGLRYSLCLVNLKDGEVLVLYDNHRGKPHHRHLRRSQMRYHFVNEEKLMDDFLRDVDLIVEGKL